MSATRSDRPALKPLADADLDRQVRQAEELLFSDPRAGGFAKALYRGEIRHQTLFPYPQPDPSRRDRVDAAVADVRRFVEAEIDAAQIDRDAEIPASVIAGLARHGVLGMTAPEEFGGLGFRQAEYCRVMEILGGHDASTAVFVNAHHSIGIRALLLFGTEAQRQRWLGPLVRGEKLAAFALTEEQAGSDAANVQTTATPEDGGRVYRLNGGKRYITNGGIADVLTVMARTPDPKGGESRVTAFLVTPDMPGFEVLEARMPKTGIRGTATGRLAFHDMPVPAENILGPLGKGLKVALTVLDFGRTTFGASCTGMAKTCLQAATRHAASRRQFGKPLGHFELVKKKLARMAAFTYAMEAATYETAALIDSGAEDYMLETAILKVFATEALWEMVYETLQIHGGQGYFLDEPYERWMRDARINQIGEGANEVLKAFIAVVGMRDVGLGLMSTAEGLKSPGRLLSTLWSFGREHAARAFATPTLPVRDPELRAPARALARRVRRFGWAVEQTLIAFRRDPESFFERQYIQERIADAAIALYASACTLARLDCPDPTLAGDASQRQAGRLYLDLAGEVFDRAIQHRFDPIDRPMSAVADALLAAAAPPLAGPHGPGSGRG